MLTAIRKGAPTGIFYKNDVVCIIKEKSKNYIISIRGFVIIGAPSYGAGASVNWACVMSKSRVHLWIEGRVQGVFFRASTMDKARELGLTGWVKNNPDGSVEIVAEGAREVVEELVTWSHKGPRHAVVDNVEVEWEPWLDEYKEFTIE